MNFITKSLRILAASGAGIMTSLCLIAMSTALSTNLSAEPIHISADDLYSAYEANEIAADARFKGESVIINGKIQNIGKDVFGSPYVIIGGTGLMDGVQCLFPKSSAASLASLSKGALVTISGKVSSKMGNVIVRDGLVLPAGSSDTTAPRTETVMPETPSDVAAAPADAAKTASGLASKVLQAGKGDQKPAAADTVTVHYSGWTTDGKLFDSSVMRDEPIVFPLNQVIPGWTEGVQLMVEGEKRRLWIPAKLAYGESPPPGAPAGTLVFDVELIQIVK